MICKECKGSGHDPGGRPIIKLTAYVDDDGCKRTRHVTKSVGSGCLTCLGRGVVYNAY